MCREIAEESDGEASEFPVVNRVAGSSGST
jgi:hypothetical protein